MQSRFGVFPVLNIARMVQIHDSRVIDLIPTLHRTSQLAQTLTSPWTTSQFPDISRKEPLALLARLSRSAEFSLFDLLSQRFAALFLHSFLLCVNKAMNGSMIRDPLLGVEFPFLVRLWVVVSV